LRSSPGLAERLAALESKLAEEERRAVCSHRPIEASGPRSPQFYAHFVATIAKQFRDDARETRATLSELLGGGQSVANGRCARVSCEQWVGRYNTSARAARANSGCRSA
jgi:hypothetical protein